MNYFTLFGLVILAFGLIQDYKRDKGQNVKATVLHAVCLTILIASCAGSFRILGALIRNFDKAKERFSIDIGLVPGQLHFIFYLLHSALAPTSADVVRWNVLRVIRAVRPRLARQFTSVPSYFHQLKTK
jgi:hypothetical protein